MLELINRIQIFNHVVIGIGNRAKAALPEAEAKWLSGALKEEADELLDAKTLVDQVDACGDAVVFAIGGMIRMGLTPRQILRCINAIMDANFEKKAGVKPGREGAPDAVKPEGWVGPEQRIKEILHG
jgi:predicted HAD superfamily Cof-like phosphohydrolase